MNFSERLKFERRRGELPWDVTKRILTFFSVVKLTLVTRAAWPRGQVLGKSLDLRIGQF